MKLKTMDIQKFLFTGWCPKMAHNSSLCTIVHIRIGWMCMYD